MKKTKIDIDNKTFEVSSNNYYEKKSLKTQIVLSNSLRVNGNGIKRLKNKEFGKSKKWNTFTITRNGKIYMHFNSEFHSDFLGIKDVDNRIVSIVLENMGSLICIEDVYYNHLNEICLNENVIYKKYNGFEHWEKYTTEQINSLIKLCNYICVKENIPKKLIDFNHYNNDIKKYKGIVFESNYFENSGNINPSFNIDDFNEKLNN